jgi:hypothetical protein
MSMSEHTEWMVDEFKQLKEALECDDHTAAILILASSIHWAGQSVSYIGTVLNEEKMRVSVEIDEWPQPPKLAQAAPDPTPAPTVKRSQAPKGRRRSGRKPK